MRRLFWVTVGAAGAVVVARRLEQTARRYTPAGVAERVEEAGERTTEAVGSALQRFRAARAEREHELLTTLLVTPEDGDPHAVFGRGRRERDAARPAGRVDDSEPLYDF